MRATFWGTRGSIAKAGPTTIRYGGNTSCVEVRTDDGTLIVIDCGTGAHGLGESLMAEAGATPLEGHLLITHTHWDHIQGLPFFSPLRQPGGRWSIHGPRGLDVGISETLAGQMDYTYFPVSIDELTANISFHDLVEGEFYIGDVKITAQYLNHPALTLGYRIEADGYTLVYASDHEPHDRALARGGDLLSNPQDAKHVEFLRNADLVIHDSQYLADEYPDRHGWGHSPVEYVIDAARLADVGELVVFHHDPSRTDERLDQLLEVGRAHAAKCGFHGRLSPAIEGQTIDLGVRQSSDERKNIARDAQSTGRIDQAACAICIQVSDPNAAHALRDAAAAENLRVVESSEGSATLTFVDSPRTEQDVEDSSHEHVRKGIVAVGLQLNAQRAPWERWLAWPMPAVYVRTKLRAWIIDQNCAQVEASAEPDSDR
jgi:phosphoribosyl 1,2-cyclic phosphodiesterase